MERLLFSCTSLLNCSSCPFLSYTMASWETRISYICYMCCTSTFPTDCSFSHNRSGLSCLLVCGSRWSRVFPFCTANILNVSRTTARVGACALLSCIHELTGEHLEWMQLSSFMDGECGASEPCCCDLLRCFTGLCSFEHHELSYFY